MAWQMNDPPYQDRPTMYNYYYGNPRYYEIANPPWFKWSRCNLWAQYGVAIIFINDTEDQLKLTQVSIKSVSCHSGGSYFYGARTLPDGSTQYYITSPSNGRGATYSAFVRVSNDDKDIMDSTKVWEQSQSYQHTIPSITSSNMDRAGSINGPSALFGSGSQWTGNYKFSAKTYTFKDVPVLEPNGMLALHVDITPLSGDLDDSYIQIMMDPDEMDIVFDQERGPYIWRMESDGHWHLRRPLQVFTGNVWTDPENKGGNQP